MMGAFRSFKYRYSKSIFNVTDAIDGVSRFFLMVVHWKRKQNFLGDFGVELAVWREKNPVIWRSSIRVWRKKGNNGI
jgi:hypothetical protein